MSSSVVLGALTRLVFLQMTICQNVPGITKFPITVGFSALEPPETLLY